MGLANVAATIMEHLCKHDWHGYTQGNRWGDGEGVCQINVEGQTYTVEQGDRDCSSAVIDSWRQALSKTKYAGRLNSATYTGNMRSVFVNSGLFEWKPMSFIAQRGDIYLNERNHTAMCTCPNPDTLAEFCISENGTIYGNVGDQTGYESYIHGYYNYPWDGILHFVGDDNAQISTPSSPSTSSTPVNRKPFDTHVHYALRNLNGSWNAEVTDFGEGSEGFAGVPCGKHDLLYMYADEGELKYQVHIVGGGWLDWVYKADKNDTVNGCAGIPGRAIDGVRAYYITPDGKEYKQIWYRSQTTEREGYLGVVCDDGTSIAGYTDDYAGIYGEPLDRLQMAIADYNPF